MSLLNNFPETFRGCLAGDHPLVPIYERQMESLDAVEVVRWCPACGAVAVDVDCDGRTSPGRVRPMQLSRLYTTARTESKHASPTDGH